MYLNSWGRDWEEGPRSGIEEALRPLHVATLLDAADEAAKQDRRLLVIFDQFDDYQSAHQARFRSATQTIVSAGELAMANRFWREVQALLVNGRIHCLFVTRADTTAGLESVRFVPPDVYPLDRLPATAATELLDSLAHAGDEAQPAIESAEHGWPSLRDRLVRDLSEEGSVLPVRMSIALAGLRTLPYLTVREYERHGGLEGLEAAYVEWRAQNGARAAGISNSDALKLLTAMVDREGHKTRPCTMAELCATLPLLKPETVATVVADWEKKDLLRRRLAADTGADTWSLDHDYLSGGVLAAETRANRSAVLLRDAEQDHRASGKNLWRRWRTLLTSRQQIGLIIDRLRGRFRYAEKRPFALISTVRFLPQIGIALALVIVARKQIDDSYARNAGTYLDNVGVVEGDATPEEVKTFWSVAQSPTVLRRHFILDAFQSAGNTAQLARRLPSALKAAVGLDCSLRRDILAAIRPYALKGAIDASIRNAAISSAIQLDGIDYEIATAWAASLPEDAAIEEAPTVGIQQWAHLAQVITPAQADQLFTKLQSHVEPKELAPIVGKMSDSGIAAVVASIDNQADPGTTVSLAGSLAAAPLSTEQKARIAGRLIANALKPTIDNATMAASLQRAHELGAPPFSDDLVNAVYSREGLARSSEFVDLLKILPPPPTDLAIAVIQPRTDPGSTVTTSDAALVAAVLTAVRPEDIRRLMPTLGAWAERASLSQLNDALLAIAPNSAAFTVVGNAARKRSGSWTFAAISTLTRPTARFFPIRANVSRRQFAPLFAELALDQLERLARKDFSLDSLVTIFLVAQRITAHPSRLEAMLVEPTLGALASHSQNEPSTRLTSACAAAWPAFSAAQREIASAWLVQQIEGGAPNLQLWTVVWSQLSAERKKEVVASLTKRASQTADGDILLHLIDFGAIPEPYSEATVKQFLKALNPEENAGRESAGLRLAAKLAHVTAPLPPTFTNTIFRKLLTANRGDDAMIILHRYLAQAQAFNAIAEEVLDTATDDNVAAAAAAVLLGPDASPRTVVEIAKKPTCEGPCIKTVLAHAESLVGKGKFPDRWQFAAWAEEHGFDIDGPPQPRAVTKPPSKTVLARLFGR